MGIEKTKKQNHATVLVIGGAGYIGSHLVRLLKKLGFLPIVLDNLSTGARESIPDTVFFAGDAGDSTLINHIYQQYPFTAVIHLAAFIQVRESVIDPLKYYSNNLISTLGLLQTMKENHVPYLIFSSSAAIYGNPPTEGIIHENHPKAPLTPYGKSKWMIEQILQDCCSAYHIQAIALRYFNVAGSDRTLAKQSTQPASHLIPLALQAIHENADLMLFGTDYATPDGSAIRDYIHVKDICDAHVLALQTLLNQSSRENYVAYNLGTGKGHSVLEVIRAIERITQKNMRLILSDRRQGDPQSLVADSLGAQQYLGWQPENSNLSTIIEDAIYYEMFSPC